MNPRLLEVALLTQAPRRDQAVNRDRVAALVALVELDPASARTLAQEIATKDAEPRVRETAAKIAKGSASPR